MIRLLLFLLLAAAETVRSSIICCKCEHPADFMQCVARIFLRPVLQIDVYSQNVNRLGFRYWVDQRPKKSASSQGGTAMSYLTDAAAPSAAPGLAAGQDMLTDGWTTGGRTEHRDNSLDAARGIAIAVLLALPAWGAVALAIRWLVSS